MLPIIIGAILGIIIGVYQCDWTPQNMQEKNVENNKNNNESFFDSCCKSIVHTDKFYQTTMPKDNTNEAKDFADWLVNKNNHS